MQDLMSAPAPAVPETRRPRRLQPSLALMSDLDECHDISARVFRVGAAQRSTLVSLARRRLRRTDLDEDVVQEAIIYAATLCERSNVREPGAIFGMLTQCVGWKAMDANRAGLRGPELVGEPDTQTLPASERGPDDLLAAVADLLAQVPECDREALLLRACYQLSYREVSERTGQTQRRAALGVERTLERMRDLYSSREAGQLCEEASALLPKLQAGTLAEELGTEEAARVSAHAKSCLRCQREQRFYRRGIMSALAPGLGAAGLGMGALGAGSATAIVASLPLAPLAASTMALMAAGALIPVIALGPALHHTVPPPTRAKTSAAPIQPPIRVGPRKRVRPVVRQRPRTSPSAPQTAPLRTPAARHAAATQEFLP